MPISHQYKCIFIHIPKACGTSIGYALNISDDKTDLTVENRDSLYGRIDRSSSDLLAHGFLSPVLQHLTVRDLKKILPPDIINNYFKFTFVRNPWDRMVSWYHYEPLIYSRISSKGYSVPSFAEFIENLNTFSRQEQYSFIVDENGETQVDFVGRFENLNYDYKSLCKKIKWAMHLIPVVIKCSVSPYGGLPKDHA